MKQAPANEKNSLNKKIKELIDTILSIPGLSESDKKRICEKVKWIEIEIIEFQPK